MREIDPKDKIQADSLVEIKRGLRNEAERLSDDGMKFEGHVVWPGNLLNGLLSWYLSQIEVNRERIAREGLAIFLTHLESDKQFPFTSVLADVESGSGRGKPLVFVGPVGPVTDQIDGDRDHPQPKPKRSPKRRS